MASNLAAESKGTLMDKLRKAHASTASIREKAKEATEKTARVAFTIGGGALGGYIDKQWGDKDVFGLTPGLAAGFVGTVVGIMGYGGEMAETVGNIGTGVLCYEAGKRVKDGK